MTNFTSSVTFRVGSVYFTLEHDDAEFLSMVQSAFATALAPPGQPILRYHLTQLAERSMIGANEFDVAKAIEIIRWTALAEHGNALYVEGAVLVTGNGTTVMLAGAPGAGKTTLTVTMARSAGWKIISEDMCLFTGEGAVIPYLAPMGLRNDSQALIECSTGVSVGTLIGGRWLFDPTLLADASSVKSVHLAVLLERSECAGKLTIEALSSYDMLKGLLPLTNAPYIPSGPDVLINLLGKANCYKLADGTLPERQQRLLSLTRQIEQKG